MNKTSFLALQTLPHDWERPGKPSVGCRRGRSGAAACWHPLHCLLPPPGMGSKDQTEREGGVEAGAGGVTRSTWTGAKRVLVLQPGVRPEPLRWESRVQDTGPPETSQPHVLSISESFPRDLCLNAKTQLHSTTSKLQCWMPHTKQRERQEHNPTH